MWTLSEILDYAEEVDVQLSDGSYVPARPMPGPFAWRVRDAWAVLTGKADAFTWPGGQ